MNYMLSRRVIGLLFLLGSCTDQFLNLSPLSNANVENFYKTEKDFEVAVNGAYVSLRASGVFHDYVPLMGDLHSDNTTVGTTAGARTAFFEMSEFRDQPTSTIVSTVWNHHYEGIARCNIVLDRIEPVLFDSEPLKNQYIAEARFLRALYYFNLVRIFGDVPLIVKEVKSIDLAYGMGRTPVQDIYASIEADLQFATTHLPATYAAAQVGKATSGAAKGLLGKVYLTRRKFAESAQVLKEVISSGRYQLLPHFADLWKTTHKNSRESLFEVQFKKQAGSGTGSNYSVRFTPYLSSAVLVGAASTEGGYNTPTEDLLAAYSDSDLRKAVSVAEGYTDQNGNAVRGLSGRHTKKFLGAFTAGQGADDNWPVLRYADVLLLYAEALNEVGFQPAGEAFTYLNQVRARAGLAPLSPTATDEDLRVADQRAFRLALEKERRLELALEGHRWFDLVRTGRALEVLQSKQYPMQEYHLLFPIPQQQIDINPRVLTQNTGY
ncbi:RagB/SusD family nutrient uptake outer membrane protein [Rhabdobacter roseus]|nr:RagB/SusD family nutrient uptake outer membrane protein [Rhabdobacter roseus]